MVVYIGQQRSVTFLFAFLVTFVFLFDATAREIAVVTLLNEQAPPVGVQ